MLSQPRVMLEGMQEVLMLHFSHAMFHSSIDTVQYFACIARKEIEMWWFGYMHVQASVCRAGSID